MLSSTEFDSLVEEAFRLIPKRFRQRMHNVAIVVEQEPPRPGLLGLYQGRPLPTRSVFAGFAMPDKITIYQGPHERSARTRAELEQVATAIEIYQSKRGQYPPDNHYPNGTVNPYVNQLYYELAGTTNWVQGGQAYYQTTDGRSKVRATDISSALGVPVSGFANSRTGGSVEEGSTVVNCVKGTLRPDQVADTPNGFKLLVGSVPLPFQAPRPYTPPPHTPPYPGSAQIDTNSTAWYCAWRYNSSSPTNNPGSYDLWIDVIIDGKTNRFSNWSRNPVIVGSP